MRPSAPLKGAESLSQRVGDTLARIVSLGAACGLSAAFLRAAWGGVVETLLGWPPLEWVDAGLVVVTVAMVGGAWRAWGRPR